MEREGFEPTEYPLQPLLLQHHYKLCGIYVAIVAKKMVERMGFEPMNRLTDYTLSKRAHSAALPSFQKKRIIHDYFDWFFTHGLQPF